MLMCSEIYLFTNIFIHVPVCCLCLLYMRGAALAGRDPPPAAPARARGGSSAGADPEPVPFPFPFPGRTRSRSRGGSSAGADPEPFPFTFPRRTRTRSRGGAGAAAQSQSGAGAVMAAISLETVPKDLRHLRACLLCSLVKTIDQFEYDGCDNCETYLQMKGNREMVYDCTSSSFDGIIAMMSPEDSWVSKWQRISTFKPGVYAVSVTGRLPQGIVRELKSRGVAYKSRDTAIKT
uniref:SPT4 homolog, DSIF elongation factor subunit n=51 Tax=Passeriformes TaxID=9126 RepID=A0A8C3QP22_9PASS